MSWKKGIFPIMFSISINAINKWLANVLLHINSMKATKITLFFLLSSVTLRCSPNRTMSCSTTSTLSPSRWGADPVARPHTNTPMFIFFCLVLLPTWENAAGCQYLAKYLLFREHLLVKKKKSVSCNRCAAGLLPPLQDCVFKVPS